MANEDLKRLPKEAEVLALRARIEKDFPALYADEILLVDTQTTRLALDDISYKDVSAQDEIETLALSCRGWLEVYDARSLTDILAQRLSSLFRTIDIRRTVVIFPGNGSQVVRDLLPENMMAGLTSVNVKTKRRVNIQSRAVEGVEIEERTQVRELLAKMKVETLVVLDDVIATGATLTALREAFPIRNSEWFGGALLMLLQNRRKVKAQSGVEGYNAIISPIAYQGTTGIPPLNSLSTLVGDSEKSETVRSKYILDYVEDKDAFLESAEKLRRFL